MGKITLNEALKKASVKNDLQMFLGLDAQSELGGMTPERLAAVAGGLFLNAKEAAPLSDDIIPKPGIYVNANDNYYPNMYGLVIVIKFHSSMILEIHVSGAAHQVKTRRHDGESWNEWA